MTPVRPSGRALRAVLLLALGIAALGLGRAWFWYQRLEPQTRPEPGLLAMAPTPVIVDRNGRALRLVTDERWARHVPLAGEAPEIVRQAFLAAEDGRFFIHPGFDPLAILRAAWDNLRAGRVVSGASTITQQLVKSLHKREKRSVAGKLAELVASIRLEQVLTKEEILTAYLNRVDLGNNLFGVETASLCYFGKRVADLNPAEAAALAALPKAPSRFDPWGKNQQRLIARRNWVLARMAAHGWLSAQEVLTRQGAPLGVKSGPPWEAPHLVDAYLAANRDHLPVGEVRLTVDLDLQREVEKILASHRLRLNGSGARQAAAVVLDNRTLEVLALAGSFEYGERAQGFVNGAIARRSAGSTLKPFLYAVAIDQGLTPATVLEDMEQAFRSDEGEYLPLNYDRETYGPVNMRLALGKSLNLPAVRLLDYLGTQDLYTLLRNLALLPGNAPGTEFYGLGLAVGNPEVRLLDLAAAYATLANSGYFRAPSMVAGGQSGPSRRLFSPDAAFLVTDMLSDPLVRSATLQNMEFPQPVALKTGTSTHYRDAWTAGYTRHYTVAVWAGNFDGSATATLPGGQGAGPIFGDLMHKLYPHEPPAPFVPPETITTRRVCALSGLTPSPGCRELKVEYFVLGNEPRAKCGQHPVAGDRHELPSGYAQWLKHRHDQGREGRYRLAGYSPDLNAVFAEAEGQGAQESSGRGRSGGEDPDGTAPETEIRITYPLDKDRYILEPGEETLALRLEATVQTPVREIVWFVDSQELGAAGPPYSLKWDAGRGTHLVQAVDENGYGEAIEVTVE